MTAPTSYPTPQPARIRLTRAQPGYPGGTIHKVIRWDEIGHPLVQRHPTDRPASLPLVLLLGEWEPARRFSVRKARP